MNNVLCKMNFFDTKWPIFRHLCLGFLPVIIFVCLADLHGLIAPVYSGLFGFDYDPAYVYLLNGYSVYIGDVPQHIDHPGTPTQILIALFLWFFDHVHTFFYGSQTTFLPQLICDNPELLLTVIGYVSAITFFGVVYGFGQVAYKASKSLSLALMLQALPLLLGVNLYRVMYISGETTGVLFSYLSLLLLYLELCQQKNKNLAWLPIVFGFTAAAAILSKITFFPLVFLAFTIASTKRKLLFFCSLAISSVILLIPVWNKISDIITWLKRISGHSGIYGTGSESFFSTEKLGLHLKALIFNDPLVFLLVSIAFVFIVIWISFGLVSNRKLFQVPGHFILALVCAVFAFLLQISMVLKHFLPHYFLPSSFVSMYILIVFYFITRQSSIGSSRFRFVFRHYALIVLVVLCLNFFQFYVSFRNDRVQERFEKQTIERSLEIILAAYPGAIYVGAFPVPTLKYGLSLALMYTSGRSKQTVAPFCRDLLSYDRWAKNFNTPTGVYGLEYVNSLVEEGKVVLLHLPDAVKPPSLHLQKIQTFDNNTSLYRVLPEIK